MVNTKLTSGQKAELADLRSNFAAAGAEIASFPEYRTTVLAVPEFEGSSMMRVSIAYAAPNEKKFRRKVGEYFAYSHMASGNCITVPYPSFDLSAMMEDLAAAIGNGL